MSDTQEKLDEILKKLVMSVDIDPNANLMGDYARRYTYNLTEAKAQLTDLIESAKREELEALKKESYVCTCASGGAGCDDAVFVDDIDNRIAQLKQSEESE